MAQNYLICPNNHGAPIMIDQINRLCDKFAIDGMVMHASRTCRGMTNPQFLIADAAQSGAAPDAVLRGRCADDSFYKDELLNSASRR
jgi:benzoyl-CoA reductase subunit B